MKRIFTLLLACCFACTVNAQMPDGTVVPDFTTTDLNGNSFNLYDHLNAGKTVIIDVFAVWCPPCWDYHQTHALEETYCQLGLDGTEDVVVIGIEGDGSTPAATMTGGGNSIGDWTEGVSYFLADDDDVADLLQISYFPTIYKICPSDKTIYEIEQQPVDVVFSEIFDADCKTPANMNDVAGLGCGNTVSLCIGQSVDLKTEVLNRGANAASGVTVKAFNSSGAEIASETYGGTISSYSKVALDLGSYVTTDAGDISYEIEWAMDEVDTNNNTIQAISSPSTSDNVLSLELITDQYGYETYWEVRNENGDVFASGGNQNVGPDGGGAENANAGDPGAYGNGETINVEIQVPQGSECYDFFIVDDFGDGICCGWGVGSFKLSDSQGVVFSGGSFEENQSNPFTLYTPTSANEVIVSSSMSVYPNPVSDQLTIEFDMVQTENVDLTIYNALGQKVRTIGTATYPAGTQVVNVDASSFEAGMYLVTLRGSDFASTRKFTVSK